MSIIGIDCSTLRTGYCVRNDKGEIVTGEVVCDPKDSMQQRIIEHSNAFSLLAHEYNITCAYFENGVIVNRAVALKIAEVRGAVKSSLGCIRVIDLSPSSWRKALGMRTKGKDLKQQSIDYAKEINETREDAAEAYCIMRAGIILDKK